MKESLIIIRFGGNPKTNKSVKQMKKTVCGIYKGELFPLGYRPKDSMDFWRKCGFGSIFPGVHLQGQDLQMGSLVKGGLNTP